MGISLIYRKFQGILEAEGVTRIEAEGQVFDPQLHEAVTHEDSDDHASGHVIAVLRQGYKLGDRVIRPALVRVAK
jgi:molecular chaperone GrpE